MQVNRIVKGWSRMLINVPQKRSISTQKLQRKLLKLQLKYSFIFRIVARWYQLCLFNAYKLIQRNGKSCIIIRIISDSKPIMGQRLSIWIFAVLNINLSPSLKLFKFAHNDSKPKIFFFFYFFILCSFFEFWLKFTF